MLLEVWNDINTIGHQHFDVPDRFPGVPVDFMFSLFFGHFSVRVSWLNHNISSPGTSENLRKTCSERSWRNDYDPVHIAYPSTRNTCEHLLAFFQTSDTFSQIVWTCLLPEMGFPTSFRKFPKWVWKAHFRQINLPYMGSETPFQANYFALNGVGKPISGKSIFP